MSLIRFRVSLPPVFYLNILSVVTLLLGILISYHIAQGPHAPVLAFNNFLRQVPKNRMLQWDGQWYANIALNGYHWDPVNGILFKHFQNVAFFPLYPIIEWGTIKLSGGVHPLVFILPGLVFGLWSNVTFAQLAARLLPARSAFWATVFFVFWPASCFLIMGYPTGLINLCTISAIYHYIAGRHFRAAIWCGIGTAAAPTMVFVAAALCIHISFQWLKTGIPTQQIPRLISFGFISVWGLLAFMVYLLFKFHDPFVFTKAQSAWLKPEALSEHFFRIFDPVWYLLIILFVSNLIKGYPHHHYLLTATGRNQINITFQYFVDILACAAAVFAITTGTRRLNFREISLASTFVFFGYLWFFASSSCYFMNGLRLIYPAIIIMLVFGDRTVKTAFKQYIFAIILIILTITETALVGAGYLVL